uniref:Uncharacterized protein n=1 Tax=uncultured bacterium contig00091 TaxID=1181562 RepID=A0A806KDS1_9BACT|nr:hypothetical protein [uncultured bacterium contig00091]
MAARKESALEQRQRRQREDMEEKDKQLAAQCEDIEGRFPPRKSIPKPSWANLSPGELFMHNYKIHAKPAADSSQTSEEKTVEKKQAAADASTQAAEQVEQAEEKERKRRTAQYIARKN